MKNGLYSITTEGLDGVEWPPGGVFFLQNGSYTCKDGIFRGECVAKPHTPPPASHLYFNTKEVGVGIAGSYEGDRAEVTASIFFGKRSLALQAILEKLADI